MKINRQVLEDIARKTADQCAVDEPWVHAIYLTGSVVNGEPLIGGTADIDLVIVHDEEMEGRELRRITEDVHVDILHQPLSFYKDGRNLRSNPVWGHTLFYCLPLYDPKHFLNIVQASVRGMYKDPVFAGERVDSLLTKARGAWLEFHNLGMGGGKEASWKYLNAVKDCVNAVACINNGPLSTRGFMMQYKKEVDEIGLPGLYQGLLGLLGGFEIEETLPSEWLDDWKEVLCSIVGKEGLEEIGREKQSYYFKAVETLLDSEDSSYALWPVLYTWNLAILNTEDKAALSKWEAVFSKLGLCGEGMAERLEGLDLYLDQVEALVNDWKQHNGI